jgi:hypothetical protein
MVKRKTKKVNKVFSTVFVILFVSIFSWLLIDGVIALIGEGLSSWTKIIIGLIGVLIGAAIGWVKS